MRKYKSGSTWAFWRWTEVDSEYVRRLHILKTPWFAICLHWILKPDAEPWLHDHPVSFLSIILRGGYAELRHASSDDYPMHRVHRWFNFIRASDNDRHRIIFARKNTLTLCFMGPKVREWGFHMPEGWVMWKDYYRRLRAGEAMRSTVVWSPEIGRNTFWRREVEPLIDAQITRYAGALTAGEAQDAIMRVIDTGVPAVFIAEAPTNPGVDDGSK